MSYATLLQRKVVVQISAKKQFAGLLRNVGDDYLVLDDEMQGELILPLEHIKQLRVAHTAQAKSAAAAGTNLPDSFHDILRQSQKSVVLLEAAGAEPVIGYLLDTQQDYLTLCTIPDGVIHIPLPHVLALSLLDVVVQPEFIGWVDQHPGDWKQADRFETLLQKLTGQLIQLGRGSPEDLSGILKQIHPTALELVAAPHETVLIPLQHVKAITRGIRFDWPIEQNF